jgi:F-type H+-transporting ATPase subunit delta
MNQGIISTRYAKALIKVGCDNNCLDALKADMELMSATIGENPMFRQILDSPVIKPPQKRKVMDELLEKRIHPLTLNFINIIIHNRREILLADVARNFVDQYERLKGIKRAHIVSAAAMDEKTKQQLQRQLKALYKSSDVQMTAETNPDLIGGFILRVGDQQYDASLSSGLERIKKQMVSE